MYGYYQQPQMNTGDFMKRLFFGKNILSRLILINTAVYVVVIIVKLFSWLFNIEPSGVVSLSFVGEWLALPSNLHTLLIKPWTVFTYMFLHEGFLHLLFNMIVLYFGSIIFLEYLSQSKLLWTYIMGGIAGALFFVSAFNIFPVFANIKSMAVALGASASVLAIIIAIATYVPNYSVNLFLIGRVKMKYLAIIFVVLDILSIQSNNPGGHIAHLGGALWGFVYALSLKKGTDFYSFFNTIKLPQRDFFKSKNYKRFNTSRPLSGRPITDEEYNKRRAASQKEIDKILEKISKSGYSSLSKEEKNLLFNSSRKNQ